MAELAGEGEGPGKAPFVVVSAHRPEVIDFKVAEKDVGATSDAHGPVTQEAVAQGALGLGFCLLKRQ